MSLIDPAIVEAVEWQTVRALVNVSRLPEWMQVPALGRDMRPLGELVADTVAPLIADAVERAKAEGIAEGERRVRERVEAVCSRLQEGLATAADEAQHQKEFQRLWALHDGVGRAKVAIRAALAEGDADA